MLSYPPPRSSSVNIHTDWSWLQWARVLSAEPDRALENKHVFFFEHWIAAFIQPKVATKYEIYPELSHWISGVVVPLRQWCSHTQGQDASWVQDILGLKESVFFGGRMAQKFLKGFYKIWTVKLLVCSNLSRLYLFACPRFFRTLPNQPNPINEIDCTYSSQTWIVHSYCWLQQLTSGGFWFSMYLMHSSND